MIVYNNTLSSDGEVFLDIYVKLFAL